MWVLDALAGLIADTHRDAPSRVVESVLGTTDPGVAAEILASAVAGALGVHVADALFYEPGVGIVAGVELADGRAVVAKVHRAEYMSRERLAAVARVQADLAAAGAPAPAPLAGPLAVGHGWLTVEEYRGEGRADGYDPAVRGEMAAALHGFVVAARSHSQASELGHWIGPPVIDGLWPEPHDLRFDFAGTAAGAEWIDESARTARAVLAASAVPSIVGHLDWRVQNLGFAGGRVAAIYDWDSVGLVPEAALVGVTSAVHPIDWRLGLADPLPTLVQLDGFVADYEQTRGVPFAGGERDVLVAAQQWIVSYGARCQHSDHVASLTPQVDHAKGWPRLLRELLDR